MPSPAVEVTGWSEPLARDERPPPASFNSTQAGAWRHPAFLGLRTDKKALDVIREQT